jgi:hypothetical protein
VPTEGCVKGELNNEKRGRCPSEKGKREAMRPGIFVRHACRVPLTCGGSGGPGCRAGREGGGRVSTGAGAKAVRAGEYEREEGTLTWHDAWQRRFYACTARDLTLLGIGLQLQITVGSDGSASA